VNRKNTQTGISANRTRRNSGAAFLKAGFLLGGLMGLSALSQAQTTAPAADESLTWHGITLYGIVDLGLQYDTHAAPVNDYFPAGTADIIQKNGNGSVTGVTPNNLSQSRIGLKGAEPLVGDWSAVFKVETFFNPQSGDISDGLKSLVQNNGRALDAQTTNIDTSVAGQLFQQSYAGLSSPSFGTLTFGRQNTLLADGIAKYDPEAASQAFSLIGLSGTTAGGGDTEDRRLDESFKYVANFSGVHVGALYKLNGSSGSANSALQFQLGADYAGLAVDAYYAKVNDAVSVSALSAAQVTGLAALGFSPSNSLTATISDNTSYAVMASYNFGAPKIFAGYEHIQYANPSQALPVGFTDIGGYVLAYVNNAPYKGPDKVLQVYWAGLKYAVASNFDVTIAYYGYNQNSYATGADPGCSSTISGTCSGTLNAFSLAADYRFTKRFDGYAGFMWSGVKNGLAAGYLNTSNVNPTIGVRYQF
jgi:predicted porin